MNLNPCLNIFEIKENNNKKEIEVIQHINLKRSKENQNKTKYNKILEINTPNNDCFVLFADNIIELWFNNNKNNIINYEFIQSLKIVIKYQ